MSAILGARPSSSVNNYGTTITSMLGMSVRSQQHHHTVVVVGNLLALKEDDCEKNIDCHFGVLLGK